MQATDPNFEGGANKVTLTEAKRNFKAFGAICKDALQHVRPPFPEEIPERS